MELPLSIEFVWDRGNKDKNWTNHQVAITECEEAFFDNKKQIHRDEFHSEEEDRFLLIGMTRQERLLFIVFTTRRSKIRIISARDLNRKEYHLYE